MVFLNTAIRCVLLYTMLFCALNVYLETWAAGDTWAAFSLPDDDTGFGDDSVS